MILFKSFTMSSHFVDAMVSRIDSDRANVSKLIESITAESFQSKSSSEVKREEDKEGDVPQGEVRKTVFTRDLLEQSIMEAWDTNENVDKDDYKHKGKHKKKKKKKSKKHKKHKESESSSRKHSSHHKKSKERKEKTSHKHKDNHSEREGESKLKKNKGETPDESDSDSDSEDELMREVDGELKSYIRSKVGVVSDEEDFQLPKKTTVAQEEEEETDFTDMKIVAKEGEKLTKEDNTGNKMKSLFTIVLDKASVDRLASSKDAELKEEVVKKEAEVTHEEGEVLSSSSDEDVPYGLGSWQPLKDDEEVDKAASSTDTSSAGEMAEDDPPVAAEKVNKKKRSRSHSRVESSSPSKRSRKKKARKSSQSTRKTKASSSSKKRRVSRVGAVRRHSLSRSPDTRTKRSRPLRSHSRSRDLKVGRHRSRSRSRSRERQLSSRSRAGRRRSLSRSRRRSRSRSNERPFGWRGRQRLSKSRSRSRSRDRKDLRLKIDKAKLRRIAITNVLRSLQAESGSSTTISVDPEQLGSEQVARLRAGGVSLEELTDVCQRISERQEKLRQAGLPDCDIVNLPYNSDDEEEDIKNALKHPFRLNKSELGSFKINIRNSQQLPIKSSQERLVDHAKLTAQFPVSAGIQHKTSEWIPVEDAPKPPVAPPPKKPAKVPKPVPPPPPPVGIMSTAADTARELAVNAVGPTQPTTVPAPETSTNVAVPTVEKPTPAPGASISEGLSAIRRLTEGTKKAATWLPAGMLSGHFTGEKSIRPMTIQEHNRGLQAWTKKDTFTMAPAVQGGIGKALLLKMGWRQGEGLGKKNEGATAPLSLDIKMDRRGLAAVEETGKQGGMIGPVGKRAAKKKLPNDLSDKHPVSLLTEYCRKRHIPQPTFSVLEESGPSHSKTFLTSVVVNGIEYQPATSSKNKKEARSNAAHCALVNMGIVLAKPL